MLEVPPALGRPLTLDDDSANAAVVVLSFGTWAGVFGRDPTVIGRTVSLDRRPYTIVGVMPESFTFPPRGATMNGEPAALFVPMAFTPFERQAFGMMYNNTVVGRLKPGVSLEAARSEIAMVSKRVIGTGCFGCSGLSPGRPFRAPSRSASTGGSSCSPRSSRWARRSCSAFCRPFAPPVPRRSMRSRMVRTPLQEWAGSACSGAWSSRNSRWR